MFEAHPQLQPIDAATVVWRYMSLEVYLDLLRSSELYFARADRMEDPWEGMYGPANVDQHEIVYGDDDVPLMNEQMSNYARRWTYLSCWHASPIESDAMWRIYSAIDRGLAIRSSWGHLTQSLLGEQRVSGAAVTYVDYDVDFVPEGNLFYVLLHKRLSYLYEREMRLLTMLRPPRIPGSEVATPPGVEDSSAASPDATRVRVDLDLLVDEVVIAPRAPVWIETLVQDVTAQYERDWPIKLSTLLRRP